MTEGFVYVLENDHMPGLVKIGMTQRSVEGRLSELYQTGVPGRFTVSGSVFSPNCRELERDVHLSLDECRVSDDREFFRVLPHVAVDVLDLALEEQIRSLTAKYIEGFEIVHSRYFIDPSSLYTMAHALGVEVDDVVNAIHSVRLDDERVDFHELLGRAK